MLTREMHFLQMINLKVAQRNLKIVIRSSTGSQGLPVYIQKIIYVPLATLSTLQQIAANLFHNNCVKLIVNFTINLRPHEVSKYALRND